MQLLVAHRPLEKGVIIQGEEERDPGAVYLSASAYSLNQSAFVAHSSEVCVWYDYAKLKRCNPEARYLDAVYKRGPRRI